ncbi:hypothetical protein HQ585_11795 [candidate division KSB1 bacterium]|nr:hypothetical protein [candidate division KSB1 bacterium]
MVDHLHEISKAENIQIEEDALALLVKKADGSLRDSQSLLDQMISYTTEKITVETISQALGLLAHDVFFDVTDMIAERDPQKALALVDHVVSEGVDLEEFVSGLIEHFRNLLIVTTTGNAKSIDVAPTYEKRYLETVSHFQAVDILRLIRILSDAAISLKRDINPRVTLEMTLYKMANMDQTVQISELLQSLAEIKGQIPLQSGLTTSIPVQSKPAPDKSAAQKASIASDKSSEKEEQKTTEQRVETKSAEVNSESVELPEPENPDEAQQSPPEKGLISIESVKAKWDEVIKQVKKKKITIGSFLMEGKPIRVDDHVIEIEFGHTNSFHVDAIMRCKKMVQEVLAPIFGEQIDFRCTKGASPAKDSSSSTPEENAESLEEMGKTNSAVQKLIDDFDVEIVKPAD